MVRPLSFRHAVNRRVDKDGLHGAFLELPLSNVEKALCLTQVPFG
jgi:hypothetical protein